MEAYVKYKNPKNPFWEKSKQIEKERRKTRKENKIVLIVATLFCLEHPKAVHELRSDQKLNNSKNSCSITLTGTMLGDHVAGWLAQWPARTVAGQVAIWLAG